jgi:hypothetical protein
LQPPYDANEKFGIVLLSWEWFQQSYHCGFVSLEAILQLLGVTVAPFHFVIWALCVGC